VLYENGEKEGTYLFSRGWLVEYLAGIIPKDSVNITDGGDGDDDERLICDRSNIVYNWINRHRSEHYFIPVG
jgi:hypothetical protein